MLTSRDSDPLPGVAVRIQVDGKIAAEAALGVRALRHPEPVSIAGRWRIDSDAQAFTSTLLARLELRCVIAIRRAVPVEWAEPAEVRP